MRVWDAVDDKQAVGNKDKPTKQSELFPLIECEEKCWDNDAWVRKEELPAFGMEGSWGVTGFTTIFPTRACLYFDI